MSAKTQKVIEIEMELQARDRISGMGFNQEQLDFIWADWPNRDEHVSWLLTASREEITDWVEAGK